MSRPNCRDPGDCSSTRVGHCPSCASAMSAAAMRADPERAAACRKKVSDARRSPENQARSRAALDAVRADPKAEARRVDALAEANRRPDRRAASAAMAKALHEDPATARIISVSAKARQAEISADRRARSSNRLGVPMERLGEITRLQRSRGMTQAEAAAVVRDRVERARRAAPAFAMAPLEAGAYGVIMVDPPWTFNTRGEPARAAVPYTTMSLKDVMDMPIRTLAGDDCWLWLWGLTEMVPQAMAVLDAWEFNFVTSGTWVKQRSKGGLAFGRGYVLRNSEEPYFLARRGRPRTSSHSERNTILAAVRDHSRKPDEAYSKAERLFGPARRADVFARETRVGWEGWGHEATKFDGSSPTDPTVMGAGLRAASDP